MFKSKKKKATFDPPAEEEIVDEPGDFREEEPQYAQMQTEHGGGQGGGHGHSSHHEMGRSNPRQILNMLAQSSNEFAAGIAMVVKALADANASPPASPIMVDYRAQRMAFGRRNLGRLNGWDAIRTVAQVMFPTRKMPEPARIEVQARLFTEDGSPDRRPVGVDVESWGELLPYMHTLYIIEKPEAVLTKSRDREKDRDRYRDRDRDRDRDKERDRGVERERDRGGERERERDRGGERERERDRGGERERDRRAPRESFSAANPEIEHREDVEPTAYAESAGGELERESHNDGYPPPDDD